MICCEIASGYSLKQVNSVIMIHTIIEGRVHIYLHITSQQHFCCGCEHLALAHTKVHTKIVQFGTSQGTQSLQMLNNHLHFTLCIQILVVAFFIPRKVDHTKCMPVKRVLQCRTAPQGIAKSRTKLRSGNPMLKLCYVGKLVGMLFEGLWHMVFTHGLELNLFKIENSYSGQ